MPGPINGVARADGSLDWSGGVDSVRVPTIQSAANPNGLARNQLAWLDNGTVRDGGITPRGGYSIRAIIANSTGLFQGMAIYSPLNDTPYFLVAISGRIIKVTVDPYTFTDLTERFGMAAVGMPATEPYFYFCQAEQFMIIQAGDETTLPLFWDGSILRRSKGITNKAVAPGTPGVNEIPAGTAMDYYMGRVWYGTGNTANAGDIVQGPSGTAAYNFKDAVLNVTENPLVLGGDGFSVSSQAGKIRAIFHNANLNSQLGQGNLFIGTSRNVYSLSVPVSRTDWIAANNTNQPLMTVVQTVNGPVNDRSVVQVNGDVYYQSLEPSVRSLLSAIRYFNQPGNIEISAQENRVLQFNDRALLKFASGFEFGSRLFQTSLPKQLSQGVVHQALLPLDFIPMSSFGSNQAPVWEGMNEGLQVLQGVSGDFNGRQRAFVASVSTVDSSIELWELSEFNQFNSNRYDQSARTTMYAEFPAFTWGDEFLKKKLVSAELWVDRIYGTVLFNMQYRPDGETCWLDWHKWQVCSAKSSCEDVHNPVCYPVVPYGEGYRSTMTLPEPPATCEITNGRPSTTGYQFQVKLTVTGFCRIRGLLLYMLPQDRRLYENLVCGPQFACPVTSPEPTPAPIPIPTPTPTPPTPPPIPSGWAITSWSTVLSQLTGGGTCTASTASAWNGIFDQQTTWSGGALWYFTAQSINSKSVSADEAPHYPNGDWPNLDTPTQLFWDSTNNAWFLWIICNSGDEIWYGQGPSTFADPTGTYTRVSGDSATPATIDIAQT